MAGPTVPFTWLWITIQPGPWLKASATITEVPSVSWSLTVTDGFPPVTGIMGVGFP